MRPEKIMDIINYYGKDLCSWTIYTGYDIPQKKLDNAMRTFGDPGSQVFGLLDATVFGSAKEGILFTDRGIDYNYIGERGHIGYNEIREIFPTPDDHTIIRTSRGDHELGINFNTQALSGMLSDLSGNGIRVGMVAPPPPHRQPEPPRRHEPEPPRHPKGRPDEHHGPEGRHGGFFGHR